MNLISGHVRYISIQHANSYGQQDAKATIEFHDGSSITVIIKSQQQLSDIQQFVGKKLDIAIIPDPGNLISGMGKLLHNLNNHSNQSGPPGPPTMPPPPMSHFTSAADDGPSYECDKPATGGNTGFSGCYHRDIGTYDSGFTQYKYCKGCGHKMED